MTVLVDDVSLLIEGDKDVSFYPNKYAFNDAMKLMLTEKQHSEYLSKSTSRRFTVSAYKWAALLKFHSIQKDDN